MNTHARTFEAKPAVREEAPLLIGIEGPPGAGKSYSALVLASGIQDVRGGDVIVVDTEGTRSLMYADQFTFRRVQFDPPFRSTDFLAAVRQQLMSRPAAIIIDNFSDEHEGEGGLLDWHEQEIDRMLGDDRGNWSRRQAMSPAGWITPKRERIKMINAFQRMTVPLIFCYRSRQKTKPMTQMKNGREVTVPVALGWQPICPSEIAGAMTIMCLLPQYAEGVPLWKSELATQDFVVKLPAQFKAIFAQPGPITREHGRALAAWAKGSSATPHPAHPSLRAADTAPGFGSQADPGAFSPDPSHDAAGSAPAGRQTGEPAGAGIPDRIAAMTQAETRLRNAAEGGTAELTREWRSLPKWMRSDASMVAVKDELKPRAASVTAEMEG